jgi:hypothetical protein
MALRTTEDFLKLITSEHVYKPKYIQTVTVSIQPLADESVKLVNFPFYLMLIMQLVIKKTKQGSGLVKQGLLRLTMFSFLGIHLDLVGSKGIGADLLIHRQH